MTETQVETLTKEAEGLWNWKQSDYWSSHNNMSLCNTACFSLAVKRVAFSASLLGTESKNIGPFSTYTPLVFKYVVANIGNAYNPHTGTQIHIFLIRFYGKFDSTLTNWNAPQVLSPHQWEEPTTLNSTCTGIMHILQAPCCSRTQNIFISHMNIRALLMQSAQPTEPRCC